MRMRFETGSNTREEDRVLRITVNRRLMGLAGCSIEQSRGCAADHWRWCVKRGRVSFSNDHATSPDRNVSSPAA